MANVGRWDGKGNEKAVGSSEGIIDDALGSVDIVHSIRRHTERAPVQ